MGFYLELFALSVEIDGSMAVKDVRFTVVIY